MPRFSANISTMFSERPFLERFRAAADAGFRGVEYQFGYDHDAAEIRRAIEAAGLEMVLHNTPPDEFEAGMRGYGAVPGREADFADAVARTRAHAGAVRPSRIHVMAGIAEGAAARATFVANLRHAAAAIPDRTLVIEAINTRDVPGYFLTAQRQAIAIVEEVGAANVKIMFDLYHRQIMEGDLIRGLEECLPWIGHVQMAGNPGRHEPDVGEVNFPAVFAALDALGYDGWVGSEYVPAGRTEDGLGWFAPWRGFEGRR